jgi:hypothetical protein
MFGVNSPLFGRNQSQGGVPGYVAPSQLSQGPVAQQNQAAPQMSPFAQQMMQRSMAPNPMVQEAVGLQAALQQLTGGMQNRPMMRSPMPQYQNPALSYRPDMAQVQQNLTRVQPSVYKTDLDNARARIAELEAAQQPQDTGYYGGGG